MYLNAQIGKILGVYVAHHGLTEKHMESLAEYRVFFWGEGGVPELFSYTDFFLPEDSYQEQNSLQRCFWFYIYLAKHVDIIYLFI